MKKAINFNLSKILLLLAIAIVMTNLLYADTIYVSVFENSGTIIKYDSNKNRSVFASGLSYPQNLAFDNGSNLYASMLNAAIDKIDPSGNKSSFSSGSLYHGGAGLAFDSSGNLYSSHQYSGIIEKFDLNGNSTVFASGLDLPEGIAFDSHGNLYAALHYEGKILKFDLNGNMSTFASGLDDAVCLAFDQDDNLFVSTYTGNGGNGKIEKIDTNGTISNFATGLETPLGLAFDSSGDLYVADFGAWKIVQISPDGIMSTFVSLNDYERPWGIAIAVPEPATLSLIAIGGLLFQRKRKA